MSENDPPVATNPLEAFERRWPLQADPIQKSTTHTMAFQFFGAISYTYEVVKRLGSGTTVPVIDITYSSTAPEDSFFQDLQVTTIGKPVH
jgi:hypothetical protein